MAVVVFNSEDFRMDFPQFADSVKYPDRQIEMAFNTAVALLDNTEASPVPYDPANGVLTRELLLYYLTCHILTLATQSMAGQAGPVSSSSVGSVSVSFAVPQVTDQNYYLLTACGQTYWRLSLPYRMGGVYHPVKHHHPWG